MHMPVNEAGDAGFAVWNCDWGVGVEVSEWSPLIGGHRGLHWFFSFVQVFSILFVLPAIYADFVHELGTTGDLMIDSMLCRLEENYRGQLG